MAISTAMQAPRLSYRACHDLTFLPPVSLPSCPDFLHVLRVLRAGRRFGATPPSSVKREAVDATRTESLRPGHPTLESFAVPRRGLLAKR